MNGTRKLKSEIEDLIYEREDELELAVQDMLLMFSPDIEVMLNKEELSELTKSLVDEVGEKLYTQYGLSIYRPTIFKDVVTNKIQFTQYPYDEEIN